MQISAGKFKAQCLKLMEEVAQKREEIVITKYGKPIAKLAPIAHQDLSVFGFLRGTVVVKGGIVEPLNEVWDADD